MSIDRDTAATLARLWSALDGLNPIEAEAIATDPTFGPILAEAHRGLARRRWTCPVCWTTADQPLPPAGWKVLPFPPRVEACSGCIAAGAGPLIAADAVSVAYDTDLDDTNGDADR